jgi:hypothetical protein
MEIRDRRLYRETHATFEAYCGERWGWSRSHSYEVMDHAAVAGALSDTSDTPATFRESRAILAGLEPEERENRVSRRIAPDTGLAPARLSRRKCGEESRFTTYCDI